MLTSSTSVSDALTHQFSHSAILESHGSSGGDTGELARRYFSQLSLDTMQRLYQLYQVDFNMFGYSPQLYYHLAADP